MNVSVLGRWRLCRILAVAAVVAGTAGYVAASRVVCDYPSDPRSYASEPCWDWHTTGATTLDGALRHYGVKLPPSAAGVRFYLDGGAFNGGDGFYLSFHAPRAQLGRSVSAMKATPSPGDPAQLLDEARSSEPVSGWSLDRRHSYAVWTYTDTAQETEGSIVVDNVGTDPVVYVIASGS